MEVHTIPKNKCITQADKIEVTNVYNRYMLSHSANYSDLCYTPNGLIPLQDEENFNGGKPNTEIKALKQDFKLEEQGTEDLTEENIRLHERNAEYATHNEFYSLASLFKEVYDEVNKTRKEIFGLQKDIIKMNEDLDNVKISIFGVQGEEHQKYSVSETTLKSEKMPNQDNQQEPKDQIKNKEEEEPKLQDIDVDSEHITESLNHDKKDYIPQTLLVNPEETLPHSVENIKPKKPIENIALDSKSDHPNLEEDNAFLEEQKNRKSWKSLLSIVSRAPSLSAASSSARRLPKPGSLVAAVLQQSTEGQYKKNISILKENYSFRLALIKQLKHDMKTTFRSEAQQLYYDYRTTK